MTADLPNDPDGFPGQRDGQNSQPAHAERSIPLSNNRISSRDLFAASREITIAHGDEIYRLRLTAQNKLILTK